MQELANTDDRGRSRRAGLARMSRPSRRHRGVAAIRVLVLLVLLGGAVAAWTWIRTPTEPCPVAEGQIIRYYQDGITYHRRVEEVRWCPSLKLFCPDAEGRWQWQEVPVSPAEARRAN